MLILIKRKSSVFTNSFVTGLFLHFEPVIAIKTNKPSVDVVVHATKAGSFVSGEYSKMDVNIQAFTL